MILDMVLTTGWKYILTVPTDRFQLTVFPTESDFNCGGGGRGGGDFRQPSRLTSGKHLVNLNEDKIM